MNTLKSILKQFRIPIIIVLIVLVAIWLLPKVISGNDNVDESSPIVALEAECEKNIYSKVSDVDINDFKIYLIHENGDRERVEFDDDSEIVTLDTSNTVPIGTEATVNILYSNADDEEMFIGDLSCEADVLIDREKILGIKCGKPTVSDVTAVLYSNGELCFEGSGDVMIFNEGEAPWLTLDTDEIEVEITSVSFEEDVKPTNLNYWFKDLETLGYVSSIPDSVVTMVGTFSGCENLSTAPNWDTADSLLNISYCFSDCANLISACALPSSVRNADYAYHNCSSLVDSPDMSEAVSMERAIGMFYGCSELTNLIMCPSCINMSGMFMDCINLKEMPELPSNVVNLSETFSGCLSLRTATPIPASVMYLSQAFYNCELLGGEIEINANTEDYDEIFTGAALATKIVLSGSSSYLAEMAETADSENVFLSSWLEGSSSTGNDDENSTEETNEELSAGTQAQDTDTTQTAQVDQTGQSAATNDTTSTDAVSEAASVQIETE